jgi:chromosome segregation ATPase
MREAKTKHLMEDYELALTELRQSLAAERRKSSRLVSDMKALKEQELAEARQKHEKLKETTQRLEQERQILHSQNAALEQELKETLSNIKLQYECEMQNEVQRSEQRLAERLKEAHNEIEQLRSQLQHIQTTQVRNNNTFFLSGTLTTPQKAAVTRLTEERNSAVGRVHSLMEEVSSTRQESEKRETQFSREMNAMQERLLTEVQRGQDLQHALADERKSAIERAQNATAEISTLRNQMEESEQKASRDLAMMQQRLAHETQHRQELQRSLQKSFAECETGHVGEMLLICLLLY